MRPGSEEYMGKKMNYVATITFHWATNYGAVLQAYALQTFLKSYHLRTEIIDYVPERTRNSIIRHWIFKGQFGNLIKEHNISKFRKRELQLSDKVYHNNSELKECPAYDAILAGSDQIWNESFTFWGEKKLTPSYFLNFASENTKKIAYAVSFGTEKVSDSYVRAVGTWVHEFDAVTVRENTGLNIMEQLGVSAQVVCDPTFLLDRTCYDKLLDHVRYPVSKVFAYIIHENQSLAKEVALLVNQIYGQKRHLTSPRFGIYEWLYNIRESRIVVTNSFHGVAFSLIFNTNFIVIPISGSGMNDRIVTLLESFGLKERMVSEFNQERIKELCFRDINWGSVNIKRKQIGLKSGGVLLNYLGLKVD